MIVSTKTCAPTATRELFDEELASTTICNMEPCRWTWALLLQVILRVCVSFTIKTYLVGGCERYYKKLSCRWVWALLRSFVVQKVIQLISGCHMTHPIVRAVRCTDGCVHSIVDEPVPPDRIQQGDFRCVARRVYSAFSLRLWKVRAAKG